MESINELHIILVTTAVLERLALFTTGATGAEGRSGSELDDFLRLHTNHERRCIDHLLANANVTLTNEAACVVNRESETRCEHTSLKTAIEELLNRKTEHVVQTLLVLSKKTETSQTTKKCSTLEETLGVL